MVRFRIQSGSGLLGNPPRHPRARVRAFTMHLFYIPIANLISCKHRCTVTCLYADVTTIELFSVNFPPFSFLPTFAARRPRLRHFFLVLPRPPRAGHRFIWHSAEQKRFSKRDFAFLSEKRNSRSISVTSATVFRWG